MTAKEYMKKVIEVSSGSKTEKITEEQAMELAIYNCYCRNCNNSWKKNCSKEQILKYVDRENVLCTKFEKVDDKEFEQYVSGLIEERQQKE